MSEHSTPRPDERATIVAGYRPIEQLIPPGWQQADLTANGINQHYYRTGGDRPPLVLLHGVIEGALAWLPTARALADDYDLIMLDARGHGGSARTGGDLDPLVLADDAAAAIQALANRPVYLLGFSMGASTAAFVADRQPELLRALVLGGMPEARPEQAAFSNPMESPQYRAWLDSYIAWVAALKGQSHAERMQAGLSQSPPFAPLLPEDDYVAWVENNARLDLDLVRKGGQLWSQLPETVAALEAALARLTTPTLIIKSGWSPTSSGPLEIVEEPATRPNLTTLRFTNTGHVVIRDRFDAFVEQVRAFLARVP